MPLQLARGSGTWQLAFGSLKSPLQIYVSLPSKSFICLASEAEEQHFSLFIFWCFRASFLFDVFKKKSSFSTGFGWDRVNGFVCFTPSLPVFNFLLYSGREMRFLSLFLYAHVYEMKLRLLMTARLISKDDWPVSPNEGRRDYIHPASV